ncbi:MAG: hypothetical protein K8R34_05870 [Methanosarcinales archaeon]|nr:hypothetical protein [Methanosarcinales archaeon]
MLELLLLPQLPLLPSLQSNRRRISINLHMPPACGLNTGSETGVGCEYEASTKAVPHLPVFAVLSPPAHHCTCDCVVPALARTPLLLNLTAFARVICMLRRPRVVVSACVIG